MVYYKLNLFKDGFGFDVVQTGVVLSHARFFAVDAARAAGQVGLYGVVGVLSEAHEAGIGVCGSPDADDGNADEGGEVHVGGVHREHKVEVAHDDEFLVESFQLS